MPTQEAIVNNIIPHPIEKPIPVRTVYTRPPKPSVTDQANTMREQVVAESAPPAESVKLSSQVTSALRLEQKNRQKEQALKQREKELEERLAEAQQYGELKTKIGAKDYSEAEKLGLNYEEYTKYLIEKQAGEDPNALKFKQLEDEIQAMKKAKEDSATQEYNETVAAYKKEIDSMVNSSPEFQRVKKVGRQDAVLQLILDSWEEDGTELSIQEASRDVEAYLAALGRDLQIEDPKQEESRRLPPPRTTSKTLNQNMAAVGTTATPKKPLQYLSESERYAEARRRVLERREKGIS